MKRLFENIRAECRANEWTIIELTEKLGIKRKTFYNWEQKQDIPASCLVKMAKLFGKSTDELLDLSNREESKNA